MKTSNKILLVFVIVIFLVPVFLVMSFKYKIRKDQYTLINVDMQNNPYHKKGTFADYKVIKVTGPVDRRLKINLQINDSLYYSYDKNFIEDSIGIYNQADTLFVQYAGPATDIKNNYTDNNYDIQANLSVATTGHLIIENATVSVLPADKPLNYQMKAEVYGTGTLQIGETEENSSSESHTTRTNSIQQLSVQTTDGTIFLGKKVTLGLLTLNTTGKASITIEDGADIREIKGSLSENSKVTANLIYIKKLLPFIK